jgi:hypothetical protein
MLLNNKIFLLSNFNELFNLLNNREFNDSYNCKFIYENRIAIQHLSKNNNNTVRIWNTYSLFDLIYTKYEYCSKNFIAKIDYTIYDNYIKIVHLNINDGICNLYNNPLNEDDSEDLIKELINFIKIVAEKENKKKIILEVHENLRLYEKYYFNIGFEVTDRKCNNNPYWIEVELNL